MASQQRLEVIVGPATWWLAPPADLPLPTLLAGLGGKQAEAVQELMSTQ